MDTLVKTEDLVTNFYTYEGVVKALNGVAIEVRPGETYGLVGESGCGKSVSVRSIMRIVQAPGRIEDGRVFLFTDQESYTEGIDIVSRSDTYMESLRGNDISMIFQEASTSLNPVFTIGFQVGESFFLHRTLDIMEDTLSTLDEDIKKASFFLIKAWRKFHRAILRRELADFEAYEANVRRIDKQLFDLEVQGKADSVRGYLNRERDRQKKHGFLVGFLMRFPIAKRYRRRMDRTVRKLTVSLLNDLGIPNPENVVDRYPHELSGGMQQRIVIAIALACHPRLLIADEPTSNLDVTIQAQILELIKSLKETKIASVLFITHDLGVVAEICDRVTVMYAGDTCETAPVRTLFNDPRHPYTKGLLHSVPKVKDVDHLETIPGIVPNLVHPPSGCRFHPRCPNAMDICSVTKPAETQLSSSHTVSCHLYSSEAPA